MKKFTQTKSRNPTVPIWSIPSQGRELRLGRRLHQSQSHRTNLVNSEAVVVLAVVIGILVPTVAIPPYQSGQFRGEALDEAAYDGKRKSQSHRTNLVNSEDGGFTNLQAQRNTP